LRQCAADINICSRNTDGVIYLGVGNHQIESNSEHCLNGFSFWQNALLREAMLLDLSGSALRLNSKNPAFK
jgi:hypothetical protein